ncbi:MAG TPA: alpha-amylase family glycosyl hydrolase [Candidatus Acidoferrum sp.]|nr:alpha-amylase family glycosyl hydrolase [Candidatus Acidoferrum sp.]
MYEINAWAWLEELSARLGREVKLADVPDQEWDALKDRGFDIVWLMGIYQRSAQGRQIALGPELTQAYSRALPDWRPEDVVGSPYSVPAYKPDPHIGTWRDVDSVRKKLRARGVALFLDFVGNHTALDHPWAQKNPEFYVQGTEQDFKKDPGSFYRVETKAGTFFLAHGRDPYFPPWTDTLQLNHFHAGMRAAHLEELAAIAKHCDGVRCDMAMLQLNDIFGKLWSRFLPAGMTAPATEFWTEVKNTLPNLTLLAEAYWGTEQRLLDLGFSFVYDKELYDAVRDLNLGGVRARLALPVAAQNHFARFMENHDEARCAVTFGGARLQALGTLMSTVPGMRFYHHGELEGRKIQLPIQLRRPTPEEPDPAIVAFFSKILHVTNEDVFHQGTWNLLPLSAVGDGTSENLIAYEWRLGTAWKVIVANLSGGASQGRIPLGDRVDASKQYLFDDQLNDVQYQRNGQELHGPGLFVRRDGFGAHVFDVRPL